MSASTEALENLPPAARKLLRVIVNQAYHGTLRSKETGVATMPEVHEACGLDVDGMYDVLKSLRDKGWIRVSGEYPFEEIRLANDSAEARDSILKEGDA